MPSHWTIPVEPGCRHGRHLLSTPSKKFDADLTEIQAAIKAAQGDFAAYVTSEDSVELRVAGHVLNTLGGPVSRLISEFARDVERPIGKDGHATTASTGLKRPNIEGIKETHGTVDDAAYESVKRQAASAGKSLTRVAVRAANPNAPSRAGKKGSNTQMRQQIAALQSEIKQRDARIKVLEDTLDDHQIPLPI